MKAPPPTPVIIASALAWSWGLLLGIVALVAYTLAFHVPASLRRGGELAAVFVLSFLYCYSGYGLRRGSRWAPWLALALTALMAIITGLAFLGAHRVIHLIGFVVNLTLFGLVFFGSQDRRDGASEPDRLHTDP